MSADLAAELSEIKAATRRVLETRWLELFRTKPPIAYTPDLLARGIAWELQARAISGLSSETRQMLESDEATPGLERKGQGRIALKSGNRLVRRWRGRTYVVEITDAGPVYDGQVYGSLSLIAGAITGTRWSGPKFFGLVQ